MSGWGAITEDKSKKSQKSVKPSKKIKLLLKLFEKKINELQAILDKMNELSES